MTRLPAGTWVPNPGGPTCNQPSPESCCDGSGMNYYFCLAFCVFCCMECDLGKLIPFEVPLPEALPTRAIPRDYDNFNVVNGAIGFTTSEYGKFIPIVFGSDRLTGNVFWSSGFQSKTFIAGDTTYTYNTVSFALGICEGEIDAVLRLWLGETLIFDKTATVDANGIMQPNADGFIMGMTVDLIASDSPLKDLADSSRLTKISIFNGGETQLPEGAIVAKEGFELTPAYRGLAYILFENMVVTEVIPNIYVEVLANVNAIYPRLYGNLPVPQTFFNKLKTSIVYHDPSYDQIIVQAWDDSGTGTVPNGVGVAVFDGNRLDHMYQREIKITEDFPSFDSVNPAQVYVLSTGFWLMWENTGLGVCKLVTYDPLVGRQVHRFFSNAANNLNNDFPNGFGTSRRPSGTFFYPIDNRPPIDIFYGAHTAGHVGFATIQLDGTIKMVSSQNNVLPHGGAGASAVLFYTESFLANNPTFAGGASTEGAHIYFFTQRDSGAAPWTPMAVTRATITGAGSVYAPVYTQLPDISFNEFNGVEYFHNIHKALVDPTDGCIILWIESTARTDWIAKWSPFTGTFVWKAPVEGDLWSVTPQSASTALLWGPGYWFITNNKHIVYLDLDTGIIEDKGTLTAQLLPDAKVEQQFYNAFENSLTYLAAAGSNQLVKVFLDRIARANVPLADIVTTLLERVGVLETERLVDDLQALTLVGYTVTERKSLRTIFNELGQVFRFDIVESNGKIIYKTRGSTAVGTITKDDLGDVDDNGWLLQHQETDFVSTRKINLTYRDIAREYGNNVQSVILPKYANTRFDEDAAIDVNVPVVLTATDAKSLAEILLYSKIVYQSTYEAVVGPKHIIYDPGDVLSIETADNTFITGRLRDVSVGTDRQIKMSVSQEDPDIYNDQAALFGVVGRFVTSSMTALTPRIDPILMQIPFRSDAEAASTATNYLMYLTFLNYRVTTPPDNNITVTINGELISLPSPLSFPTWGRVITPLVWRTSYFSTDYVSQMTVKLLSVSGGLPASAASKSALVDNPQMNLAYVNGELIQFETVTNLGDNVYRFTGIHRACFGTEANSFKHRAGENFVLLSSALGVLDEFSVIPFPVSWGDSPFKSYQVFMNSNNPFQPNPLSFGIALNLRPWAVAAFKGNYVGNDLVLSWKRRTRYDGQWLDDGDFETVPLNELTETYDVYLYTDQNIFNFSNAATYLRKLTLSTPTYTYTAAEQTADGFVRTTQNLFVMINQNGSFSGNDAGTAFTRIVEYKRA